MIIKSIPIKTSHVHIIVTDWIKNLFMKPDIKHDNAKFSFVYFSYQPDFKYLLTSLTSLAGSIDGQKIRNVFVFVDQKAPFNEEERQILSNACPKLVFEKVFDFSWASTKTTMAEIESFKKVIEQSQPTDFLVKIDSDIVLFKNTKLNRLLTSQYMAVGDGHHLDYKYIQGGMYMFRCDLGKRIFENIDENIIKSCEIQCGTAGEDRVISTLFKNKGAAFYLTRLMLFPDEYTLIKRLNNFLRWEFCAAHFVQDKDSMKNFHKTFNELSR